MEYEIPTDLITTSQILFRQLTGLQSYTPNLLQSQPSISDSVSTLDHLSSTEDNNILKCSYCEGILLRGANSLICIYCGEYLNNNKESLSFNSTNAYNCLLHSLNFNGSERVGSSAEGSGINGGQSPAEDEVTLSELLNIKISWPKKPDNKISKRSSSVNLGTADVDNFFIESKRATVSNVVPEDIDQNKAVDDDLSGWNADFQSADTEIVHEPSKSVKSFVGEEVDLSSQMDAVFGQMESFNNNKPNDDLDLFPSDDPFTNMSTESFQQAEPLDSAVQTNDGLSGHLNGHDSRSLDAVFGQIESFNNKKPNDDFDLFPLDDPFANMSSESLQQAEQLETVVQANDGLSGHLNSHNSKSVDALSGQMENFNNSKLNDDIDLFPSDDPFANMSSESFQQAEPLDSAIQAKDGLAVHLNSYNSKNVDAVFGQMESFDNKKLNDDLDLFPSDDLFADMSSESFQQAEQLETVVQANDGLSGHLSSHNSVIGDVDIGQMENLDNIKQNDDLDLFPSDDPFADMSSESFQQAEPKDSVIQANHGLSGTLNDSLEDVFGQMESFNNKKPNDNSNLFPSDDLFANISSESFQQADPLDSVVQANNSFSGQKKDLNSKSVDQDWFNDDNWQKGGAKLNNASSTKAISVDWFESTSWQKSGAENTATVKDDNLFDIKPLNGSNFDNLKKHHREDTSEATNWFQDSQWSIGASSSTNIAASKDNDDDGFDEWSDFTGSTGNQDSFPDSRKESCNEKVAVKEKTSELKLFPSTADPQEVDFGKSVDSFVGAEVDLSSQMDSVFGQMQSFSNRKPNDDFDLFLSDDPFAKMSLESFQQAEQLDSVQANDGLSGHLNSHNSKNVDAVFGQMESYNNKEPNDDLNLFPSDDPFANMSSEKFQQAEPLDSVQTNDGLSDHLNSHNSRSVDAVSGQIESFSDRNPNDDVDLSPSDDPFANMTTESFQQAEPMDPAVQAIDGLSSHLNSHTSKSGDADFGKMENYDNRNQNDDLEPFPSDDPFADMSYGNFQQAEPMDSVIQANHGLSGTLNDRNSVEDVCGQMESFNDRKPNNNSNLFPSDDLFANMISGSFQSAKPLDSVVQANNSLSSQKHDYNSKSVDQDWFSDDSWQKGSAKLNTASSTKALSIDWFESTSWQKSGAQNTATIKDDNLFDIKPLNDINKHQAEDTSGATNWFQDSQWSIGASSSTNITASKDNDDDELDEWNDFTSSTGNQDSFPDSRKESSNEKMAVNEKISEKNLFPSTADPQEMDFGDFLRSADLFTSSSSNK